MDRKKLIKEIIPLLRTAKPETLEFILVFLLRTRRGT